MHGETTLYEWDVEWVNANSFEIIDHDHNWQLKRLSHYERIGYVLDDGTDVFYRLVLIKDIFRDHSIIDRSWCYVTDKGVLPKTTDKGDAIPKKYLVEFEKNKSWASKLRNRIRG
jgi:hypothetical protein